MAKAVCSECGGSCKKCGGSMAGKKEGSKTCCNVCRARRSRRLKRATRNRTKAGGEAIALAYNPEGAPSEVVREVTKEELRPVVREAITEDTFRAIEQMVALTSRAVECIAEDLHSDDLVIRQRAYTLLTKYTIGHQAIVRPDDSGGGGQMVVHVNLPRPGDDAVSEGAAVELEAEELRTCDSCGEEKAITEFVAASYRCTTCYEKQRELARDLMKEHAG